MKGEKRRGEKKEGKEQAARPIARVQGADRRKKERERGGRGEERSEDLGEQAEEQGKAVLRGGFAGIQGITDRDRYNLDSEGFETKKVAFFFRLSSSMLVFIFGIDFGISLIFYYLFWLFSHLYSD